jgi:hypothetical protein
MAWTKHNLTDNTGAKTETSITYNIYRQTNLQTTFDNTPLAAGVQINSYSDTSAEVQTAFALLPSPVTPFRYRITAVDADGNESVPSDTILVPIQPFVKVFTIKNTAAVVNTSPSGPVDAVVQSMLDAVIMNTCPTEMLARLGHPSVPTSRLQR